jgi:hypothetical protein
MFPEYSIQQLFEPYTPMRSTGPDSSKAQVFQAVAQGLDAPDTAGEDWIRAASRHSTHDLPTRLSAHGVEGVDDITRERGHKLIALQSVAPV